MPEANRWCGVCFQWRIEGSDGRCASCGNAHMSGRRIPLTPTQAAQLTNKRGPVPDMVAARGRRYEEICGTLNASAHFDRRARIYALVATCQRAEETLEVALTNVRSELSNGPTANWEYIERQFAVLDGNVPAPNETESSDA